MQAWRAFFWLKFVVMSGVAGAIARDWWRSSLASKCEVQGWSLCGFLSHTTDDLHSPACRVYTSMEEVPSIHISGTSSQRKACLCQATMKSQLVWEHLHYLNIPNHRTVEMQPNALSGWVEKTKSKKASESCVAALLEYQTLSQNRFKHSASALSNHNWRKRQTANHRSKSWTNCFLLRTIFFSEGTQTWNEGLVVPLCAQFTPLPKVWEQSEPAQRLRLLPGKLWGP